jgi:hypothetical protein
MFLSAAHHLLLIVQLSRGETIVNTSDEAYFRTPLPWTTSLRWSHKAATEEDFGFTVYTSIWHHPS